MSATVGAVLASIVLARADWLPGFLLIGLLGSLLIWRGYSPFPRGWQRGALVSKLLALWLLCSLLLEPQWTYHEARPGENVVLVLVDQSQSLTIRDPDATRNRGELLQAFLAETNAPWRVRLAQDFEVREATFANNLKSVTDWSGWDCSGPQSRLYAALRQVAERFRDRPLAGVLLFTDGNATDTGTLPPGLPPIYPVMIGTAANHRDLSLGRISITTTAFEDAPITIQVEVNQLGLRGQSVWVELLDELGGLVQQQAETFAGDSTTLTTRFKFRPTQPGIGFYRLQVRPRAIDDSASPLEEATLVNNQRWLQLQRDAGPYRLLYVAGRPNWEYKFLHRAVEKDDQVDLVALLRIAKREGKFEFRGRAGESANPLFRGFDRVGDETERYDQPVIVRLNTRDDHELRDGFPQTAADLFPFHAVLIDDLEAEFLTTDQWVLLERFVAERGGGLLMLGGQESFREGGYERTPLARMLPVYLDQVATPLAPKGYRLQMTREGLLQPWARLRTTENEESQRLRELASFRTLNPTGRIKPGAELIAEVADPLGNKLPAIAVQRFGQGRCGAVLLGDLWRSQLAQADSARTADDLGRTWRQLIRWLVADVPARIDIQPRPLEEDSTIQRLVASIRQPDFQPQDNATAQVTIELPDGTAQQEAAEPSLQAAGEYDVAIAMKPPGPYRAKLEVADELGKPLGKASTGWVYDPLPNEFQQVAPNAALLRELAAKTGGEVVTLDGLERLAQQLPTRAVPVSDPRQRPLWHHPAVFLLLLGLLFAEWALRRAHGAP